MPNHKNIFYFLFFTVCLPIIAFANPLVVQNGDAANTTQAIGINDGKMIVESGGSITIATDQDAGILSTGTRASIINSGRINTTGANSTGIFSSGTNASILNSGAITTSGIGSRGIGSIEADITIINSGSITTSNDGSFGIESIGHNAIITNRGRIETAGEDAYGIVSRETNLLLVNDGFISTTGFSARAIESRGRYAFITNNGTITTSGDLSTTVYMAEDDSTLINYGTVTASGLGAHAVETSGINSVITNYGLISSSGSSSYAILGASGKQTLNIMPGSRITGRIDLDNAGVSDKVNFYGSDGSAVIAIEGIDFDDINILNPNATKIRGIPNKIVYIDPTINVISFRNLNSMTGAVHSSVEQRFTVGSPSGSMHQIKTNQITPFRADSAVWANTFIQRDQSDPEEHIQALESHLVGVVIGHERMDAVNPFGFLGGVARSDTSSSSNRRESDSLFLGAYGRHVADSVQFSGSLLFGRREHQLQRQVLDNLNGSMTASSRTRGLFLSPSIRISGINTILSSFEIQPSATITYSLERIKGYSETGADQNNIQFGRQKIETLSTRLQLEKTQTMSRGEFRVHAGVHSRNTRSRDVVFQINGSPYPINSQPDDRATGLFAGVQADIRLTGPLRLKLTAEYGELGRSEKLTNGSLVVFTPF